MNTTSMGFYPPEDDHSIPLDEEMRQNAEAQNMDNQAATLARLQAVFLQLPGNPGRDEDLATLFYECPTVTLLGA